ncbi:MAG TPA: type 4a pilus biogenesis protein PilO [Fimbriimonadaceae bacterium]|nr:type 4a pilus biogenesis protein PilO [Fimbriimonadaceae bacterium]
MTSRPNPKAFMYLALGTVVVGGALCYFQYTKLGEINGRVAKLRTEVSDPKAVQARLEQSTMKLEGAKQSLVHLEANVSSAAYVPSLLQDLDAFGKSNGIAVTGVRPAPKKPGDDDPSKKKDSKPYDELTIQVTGTGSFDSVEKFVTNLPTFPKIVAAKMVSIEPARSSAPNAKSGLVNVTVQLRAYIFKADAQAAAPATGAPSGAPAAGTPGATTAPAGTTATPGQGTAQGTKPATKPGPAGAASTPANDPNAKLKVSAPANAGPTVKTAFAKARRVRVEG